MTAFALSCFGILLYLWSSFGGPVPIKPEGYRVKAQIPQSALLVTEADVRISGLTVGKVKKKTLAKRGGQLVEMEIDSKYAPLPSDTRAILRAKSILGQIYIELTPGSEGAPDLPDGGTLKPAQVQDAVEIDEILKTFDKETRTNFQGWVKELSKAIDGRGQDLNDAIGNLEGFSANGAQLLRILDEQDPALRRLIRNSSIALGAVNEREGQLRELVTNANNFFGATASRNDALAETIAVLPTFLQESRVTLDRLRTFSRDTDPLIQDLVPVAEQLRPTLRDVGLLAPDLEQLFRDLDPLIEESGETLPQGARFLRGAAPVLAALHVYLPELNPILSFANFYQVPIADFFQNGAGSFNSVLPPNSDKEGPRHYLRQLGVINARGVGVMQNIPEYDRGTAYPAPNYYARSRPLGVLESFDCKAAGGEKSTATAGQPPCFVQPPLLWDGGTYATLGKGEAPYKPPPKGNEGSKEPSAPKE